MRIIAPGQSTVALILNGLGFIDSSLYLTSQCIENKPVATLLGVEILANDLSYYTLGHTLDQIADFGSSSLFATVDFGVAIEKKRPVFEASLVHGGLDIFKIETTN
jgi:transposase